MTMTSLTNSPENGVDGAAPAGGYYGNPIPYLPLDQYPGKIIAIEGTDGVGRSTQIHLLREWLEVQGHGVVETGWTRPWRGPAFVASIAPGSGICTALPSSPTSSSICGSMRRR
jgi:hypothetical protein